LNNYYTYLTLILRILTVCLLNYKLPVVDKMAENHNNTVEFTSEMVRQFMSMSEAIIGLQNRINELSNTGTHDTKVLDPEPFFGDRSRLRDFISQIRLVIQAQPSRFVTEQQKVIFTVTFLRGPAFSWIQPYLESTEAPLLLHSFESLITELKRVFGDPNQVASAERQLRQLKQTRSVTQYASEFRRISSLANWNDPALKSQFYVGLKDIIKDYLVRLDQPNTLDELIELSINADNRLYDRYLEKSKNNFYYPRENTTINHLQKKFSIDYTEKQRRRDNKLCMYCGSSNHQISECKTRPQIRLFKNENTINKESNTNSKNSNTQFQ
jgi:Ty3 transposon capsid-like protein